MADFPKINFNLVDLEAPNVTVFKFNAEIYLIRLLAGFTVSEPTAAVVEKVRADGTASSQGGIGWHKFGRTIKAAEKRLATLGEGDARSFGANFLREAHAGVYSAPPVRGRRRRR